MGTGSYTVTVTNAEGCTGSSAPFSVQVGSSPVAAFSMTPPSPQPMGTTVNFTDLSNGGGSTIVGWDWDFGGLGQSDVQNPSWNFVNPFTYEISLIVTAADGCTDTTSTLYLIFPPDITIPNVISPNGDTGQR
ncbi:MAG: PKD domain-containing protein, partial [Flavobacteriales bacterium]|nr:PKD domain-containing protein [Flavobacteriales bacterium]